MPYRIVVSNKLAQLLSVLSHPLRIRIIEELGSGELTVGTLKDILQISSAATSQQLSMLRAHGIVAENRQGRNVFYHLCMPNIADWLRDGLQFIGPNQTEVETIASAIESARSAWEPAPEPEEAPAKARKKPEKKSTRKGVS